MKETVETLQNMLTSNLCTVAEARALLAKMDPNVAAVLGVNTTYVNQLVGHGGSDVSLSTAAITKSATIGYAFIVRVGSLNGNGGTPVVTIKIKGAGSGGSDLMHVITAGAGAYYAAASDMTGNATGITVTPDATSDLQVVGIVVHA